MLYPCVSVPQMVDDFESYRDKLRRKRTILARPRGDQISVPATAGSRYFADGQRRIVTRLKRRLGRAWQCGGVLVTLTYDPKRISKVQAWQGVGEHRRELVNKLWLWRRRHGYGKRPLGFLAVLEVQPGTGYPHVHLVFPNVRWLIGAQELARLWGHGYTDVRLRDFVSPTAYVCKYIAKMRAWTDESLAYLHNFRVRLYSVGRRYFLPVPRVYSPWFFVAQVIAPPQPVVCRVRLDTT